ncbi:MAG TPA: family 2A encapsulin nanocompartment cargo protein cysteine desulfurase [Polyangia bacterium]|nr:family 2A encapsulin nanocompartment cargo protein cysteine desulfurase [Polyangia bacterium]
MSTPEELASEIARLANGFFQAQPELAPPYAGAPGVPGVPAPPPVVAPPPRANDLRSLPATVTGGGLPPSLPLGLTEGAPAIDSTALYFVPASSPPAPDVAAALDAPVTPEPPRFEDRFSTRLFDPYTIRRDFPILQERVNGRPLIWFDNAATTQKPRVVIDRLSYFYEHENSNIHRAAHTLAARATDAYEGARETVGRFLNAPSSKNIVFVRGTTEAINLVAQSWGRRHIQPGDEIVISWLEHHANIVPWQLLAAEKGARLRVAPVDEDGQIRLDELEKLLSHRTRLVSVSHVSNALGTVTPAREIVTAAHRYGARVMIDGAQAVSHLPVDVQSLDCDFYCFSGHKIFAPTGIGALYGKSDVLDEMPPWQGGGNMIADVTFDRTTYQPPPGRFEAGTGNIADAVGMATALEYVSTLGLENISRYEHELLDYAVGCLTALPGFRMIGTAPGKAGVISFVLGDIPPIEIGRALDQEGIAVRAGHHCAQPILRRFGYETTVRASLAPYNTREDVDALVAALRRLQAGHPTVS